MGVRRRRRGEGVSRRRKKEVEWVGGEEKGGERGEKGAKR